MSLEAEKNIISSLKTDTAQLVLTDKVHLSNVDLEQALLAVTGQTMAYDQALFDPDLQLALKEEVKHKEAEPNIEDKENIEDKNAAADEEGKENKATEEEKEAAKEEAKDEQSAGAQEMSETMPPALPKDSDGVNIDDVSIVSLLSPSYGFVFYLDEHLSEPYRVGYGDPILEQSVPRNLGIQNDFLGVIYHIFPVFPIEVPAVIGGPCCFNSISIETINNYDSTSSWTEGQISEINTILNNAFKFTFEYFCDRNEGVIVVSQVAGGVYGNVYKGGIEQYENFTPETFTIRIPSSEESCCPPLNCENPIESIQVLIDSYFVNIPCIDLFSNSYDSGATIYFIDSNENRWELVNIKKEFELRCVDTCCESEIVLKTAEIQSFANAAYRAGGLPAAMAAAASAAYATALDNAFNFTFKYNSATGSATIDVEQSYGVTLSNLNVAGSYSYTINVIQDGDCAPLNCENPIVDIDILFRNVDSADDFNFMDLGDFSSSSPSWDIRFTSQLDDIWTLLVNEGDESTTYSLVCTETGSQPIVFDLNNNGYDISSVKDSSVVLNIDGVDKQIAWVGPDDGILTYNYSGEGAIENKNFILTENVPGAKTDLQALQMLAGQKGGILDMSNPIWDKLGMWQDANQDGKMDKGEYHTLGDLKIASINLTGDGNVHYLNGNLIANNVTFNYQDGSVGKAADAILKTEDVVQANQSIPGLSNTSSGPTIVAANDAVAPVAPLQVDMAVQSAIEVQQPVAAV